MEKARRKLRIFLCMLVAAAVVVGMIYYFHDVKGQKVLSDGTLVRSWEQTVQNLVQSSKIGGSGGTTLCQL